MALHGTRWPRIFWWTSLISLVILAFPNLGFCSFRNEYESPITRRMRALEAVDLPCGSDVTVKEGEKYMFDSRSAIIFESSLYAAQYPENSYYGQGRYKRAVPGFDTVKNKPFERFDFIHHNTNNNKQIKVKILPNSNNMQGNAQTDKEKQGSPLSNSDQKQHQIFKPDQKQQQQPQRQNAKSEHRQSSSERKQQQQQPQQHQKIVKSGQSHASSSDQRRVEKAEKKTQQQQEVKRRAYGNSGGNYGEHSTGYGQNYGGSASGQNYGNAGHGRGENPLGGGVGYTYNQQGYFQPLVCEWTYFADSNCSLESHIIYFKEGEMDCNKQQFVISDNYTDFTMCGHKTFYPGFRSESAELHIKYWRTPYVHRHVFKGYVTCTGRPQRPMISEGYENQDGSSYSSYISYNSNYYSNSSSGYNNNTIYENNSTYTSPDYNNNTSSEYNTTHPSGGSNYTSESVPEEPAKEESTFLMTEVNQEEIEKLGLHTAEDKPVKHAEHHTKKEKENVHPGSNNEEAKADQISHSEEHKKKTHAKKTKHEEHEAKVVETATTHEKTGKHESQVKEEHHGESAAVLLKEISHHKTADLASSLHLEDENSHHTSSQNEEIKEKGEEESHAHRKKEEKKVHAHETHKQEEHHQKHQHQEQHQKQGKKEHEKQAAKAEKQDEHAHHQQKKEHQKHAEKIEMETETVETSHLDNEETVDKEMQQERMKEQLQEEKIKAEQEKVDAKTEVVDKEIRQEIIKEENQEEKTKAEQKNEDVETETADKETLEERIKEQMQEEKLKAEQEKVDKEMEKARANEENERGKAIEEAEKANEVNNEAAVNKVEAQEAETQQNEITYGETNNTYHQIPSDNHPDPNYSETYPPSYTPTDSTPEYSPENSYPPPSVPPISPYEQSSSPTYPSSPTAYPTTATTTTYQYPSSVSPEEYAVPYPNVLPPPQYTPSYPSSTSNPALEYSYSSTTSHYPTSYPSPPSAYPTEYAPSSPPINPNYRAPNHLSSSETETKQSSPTGRSYEDDARENVLFHPSGYSPGLRPAPLRMTPVENPVLINPQSYAIRPGMPALPPSPASASVVIAYPYNPPTPNLVGRASAPQPSPTGYQYVISSPTNPTIKMLITCQLPPPYPCTPVQTQSIPPVPIVYGR